MSSVMKEEGHNVKAEREAILLNKDEMIQSFASQIQSGDIMSDPKSPEQFYANGRLSEVKGDYGNARRFYRRYLQSDTECIDPHFRYIGFLKFQDGNEAAPETYQSAISNTDTAVSKLGSIMTSDRGQRRTGYSEFIQQHPDCGPAHYLFASEFSDTKPGKRTIGDKLREKTCLENFLTLNKKGKVLPWFIDQTLASEWIADSEQRLAHLQQEQATLNNPITVDWMCHDSGWSGTIQVAEIATELFWKPPGASDSPVSTGFLSERNYSTGEAQPNPLIELAKITKPTAFEFFYRDLNRETRGPFSVALEPAAETMSESQQILSVTKNSWLSFREENGKALLYFTHLLSHRGAFKSIQYRLDSQEADQLFDFPTYEGAGSAPMDESVARSIEIPATTRQVAIQVNYKDGTGIRHLATKPA